MRKAFTSPRSLLIYFGVVLAGFLALVLPDEIAAPYPVMRMEPARLAYSGTETVTRPEPGLDAATLARAEAALAQSTYHAAYAECPGGRMGLWSEAHSSDLAARYALAACGDGCRVLATRVPMHQPDSHAGPDRTLILRPDIARRVGRRSPFIHDGHVLAIGGAGAWGTGHASRGTLGFRRASHRAVAECEARRLAEAAPQGAESPPCRILPLRDVSLLDLRPEKPLYPAPYSIGLIRLTAAEPDGWRMMQPDGQPARRGILPGMPKGLHGAWASNGQGAEGLIDGGGWPDATSALALALCEANRTHGQPPCSIAALGVVAELDPKDVLALRPAAMEAFESWQETQGAGAFAIGPLGAWGHSYGFEDLAAARQFAADWCAYHAGRGNDAFHLRKAFIDQHPCRIVAERAP